MPLVPAMRAESELMSRQETHLTGDHTDTMEEASFLNNTCTHMPTRQSHMAQVGVHLCAHWRHCAVNSYFQAWLERKLVEFTHGVPSTHISRVSQHSFTTNFLTSRKFQARELTGCPGFHPEEEERRESTRICLQVQSSKMLFAKSQNIR